IVVLRSRWTPKMFNPTRASSMAVASPKPLEAPRMSAHSLGPAALTGSPPPFSPTGPRGLGVRANGPLAGGAPAPDHLGVFLADQLQLQPEARGDAAAGRVHFFH